MTEQQNQVVEAKKPNIQAGGAMQAVNPQSLEDVYRISKYLANAGDMIPKHFQGKPDIITAAVLQGLELGLSPMAALKNIAVINGRATIWGDALPALCQRAGHQLHETIEGDGNNMVAKCTLRRGDTGQEITRTFSVADAQTAGLWGKAGPWKTYPKRMLQMRARGFAVRDGAADTMMGIGMAEEAEDTPMMRDVTPPKDSREAIVIPDDDDIISETVDSTQSVEPEQEQEAIEPEHAPNWGSMANSIKQGAELCDSFEDYKKFVAEHDTQLNMLKQNAPDKYEGVNSVLVMVREEWERQNAG